MTAMPARPAAPVESRRTALLVGAVAALLTLIGAFFDTDQFFRSYLTALLFWLTIALGSLGLVMINQIVGGTWGFIVRRVLEAATLTMPLLALLWLGLALGYHHIWAWGDPATLAGEVARNRRTYFSLPFWLGRGVAYWLIWTALAYLLNRWSGQQDTASSGLADRKLLRLSPPGLILLVLTVSFAWIDWVMSLEPDWYSTILGFLALVSSGLAALSFALIVILLSVEREPFATVLGDKPERLNDLGNLLLTFVMLWAYISFSQFLIIWYGNLQRETVWYRHRMAGAWEYVGLALIIFHFFVPFLLLLLRFAKRRPRAMLAIAGTLITMHLIDLWWQVIPSFHPAGLAISWLDLVAPIAIGGLWLGLWGWHAARRPLLPLHDPHAPDQPHHVAVEATS